MTERNFRRYSLVDVEIVGHLAYGISFKVEEGVTGFIDKADVSDTSTSPADWPVAGQIVTCITLGIARDGRVRASARQSDVFLARSVDNPDQALRRWAVIRDRKFATLPELEEFFASRESIPLLEWARRQRVGSADRTRAAEIISIMPDELRRRLG
ncbi:S1 domain-containing protein [Streptomyces sp. NRRL F-5123]|uniref:S1 domain-containing protein n=1 Tax=Streptomyces sp. NRRL F-5123 TaxID=1463856 RepID=UPI00131E4E39|nr:S1 domain-containing protein [Streptomyces sp. NRRL F-5123]